MPPPLPYPVRSDTHCIFKTYIKKTPPNTHFSPSSPTFHGPNQKHGHLSLTVGIIQIRRDCDLCKWSECGFGDPTRIMNAVSLLPVIRFTAVYICTIVDGHEGWFGDTFDWLRRLINIPGRSPWCTRLPPAWIGMFVRAHRLKSENKPAASSEFLLSVRPWHFFCVACCG